MVSTLGSVAIILAVIVLLFRRVEVRLVLLAASTALFLLVGKMPELIELLAAELTNSRTVIPICASMGFAFVLRLTECDRHLVQFLLYPLSRPVGKALLIPGAIIAGYIVNMAIVSQSGAVAIVGSIAVPLLLRNGISRLTVGSLLLLGSSMGGELFNPAAVETVTLSKLTNISSVALAQRSIPLNVAACTCAILTYWFLAVRWERRQKACEAATATDGRESRSRSDGPPVEGERSDRSELPAETEARFKVSVPMALVPFVPLVLLFGAPKIQAFRPFHDHITILVAMLIGSITAAAVSRRQTGRLAGTFFEGMGFAYVHVISVTVCATLFAQGIIANHLIERMVGGLTGRPGPALLAGLTLPWGLAALSGSGAGAATSMMKALVPGAAAMHLDPARIGILCAMGSHYGRTMSPAAAVAILCATLVLPEGRPSVEVGATTIELTKRVAPALLVGGVALYLGAILGLAR